MNEAKKKQKEKIIRAKILFNDLATQTFARVPIARTSRLNLMITTRTLTQIHILYIYMYIYYKRTLASECVPIRSIDQS